MVLPKNNNPFYFIYKVILYAFLLLILWIGVVFISANGGESIQVFFRQYTNIPFKIARKGDSSLLRFKELDSVSNIDIIFIGSSHCYRSFDTRIFDKHGLKTFNMGSNYQTPLNSYYLIRNRFYRLKPKLVIVELYPKVLSGDGVECMLDLLVNSSIDINLIEMAISTRKMQAVNALISELLNINRIPIESIPVNLRPSDKYISGGYVERIESPDIDRVYKTTFLNFNNYQFEYLEEIYILSKQYNSNILFVIQPIPVELKESIVNYDQLMNKIVTFSKKHNVDFIDFNEKLDFNTSIDFYDSNHLSQTGVIKFNNLLIKILNDKGYLDLIKNIDNISRK